MAGQKKNKGIEDLAVVIATGLFAAYLCFASPSIFESCDYVLMWKPIWHFFADALGRGTFPLWNPYIHLGRPFLADAQNAVFYPPLYLMCAGQTAGVFLLVWLHCTIAVFGMRRLGAVLQAGRAESYFMALCFLGSGELVARWMTGQIPYCWALGYTPWLFYFAARTGEPWNGRRVAGHALALALQFLCGNPQVFWFSTIGQGVFILGRSARWPMRRNASGDPSTRAAQEDAPAFWRSIGQFGVALAWCGGLVAAALLPFMELVGQGNRTAVSLDFANVLKLNWPDLANLLFPVGISSPNWEANLFVGVIVVLLGLAGLARVQEANVRGLIAVLVAGLLLALGGSTPAFGVFYRWLPEYAQLRCHAREGFLVVFVLICGAGIWLSRPHPWLETIWSGRTRMPVRGVFAGLFLFQAAYMLYAARVMKDTYTFEKIVGYPPHFPYQRDLVEHLREAGLLADGHAPPRIFIPPSLAPLNDAMMYGYGNLDGNFSLFLRRDWDYLHRYLGLEPPEFINTSLSDKVYLRGPFPYPDLSLSAGFDPNKKKFALTMQTSPRAFVVYSAEVGNYNGILKRLAEGHDIHRSALVEQPLPFPLGKTNSETNTVAQIRQFGLNSISVDVDAGADGLLVLGEAWYPGWRAAVDGREYDCVPANIWMRGAPVPAGEHEVRFYFHQDYLALGSCISLASLAPAIWMMRRKQLITEQGKSGFVLAR